MSFNKKFKKSAKITEVEHVHDTHYIIRCEYFYIKIYLDPEQNCCEKFGIYATYKNKPVFLPSIPLVGAELNGIRTQDVKQDDEYSEKKERLIILYTSVGLVYVTAYNEHNGYYPHDFEVDIHMPHCDISMKERLWWGKFFLITFVLHNIKLNSSIINTIAGTI